MRVKEGEAREEYEEEHLDGRHDDLNLYRHGHSGRDGRDHREEEDGSDNRDRPVLLGATEVQDSRARSPPAGNVAITMKISADTISAQPDR